MGGCFSGFKTNPQGEDHEGTFIDYYRYRPNARYRRICPITERATEKQPTPRGAKSDQFKFVGAGGVPVDYFFAEFDAVRAEHPTCAFRGTEIGDHDRPVGQQRRNGSLAGSIYTPVEFTHAGADEYGSAGKQ